MMTKRQLAGIVVALNQTNDMQVLREPTVLREMCDPLDIPNVRRMCAIVSEVRDTFDYSQSPEFLRSLNGRTAEFRAMKLRLITPIRRAEALKRLDDALANIAISDTIFDLIEDTRRDQIAELRSLLSEVSNPDDSE